MADELGKLVVKIGADFSELESSLNSLQSKVGPALSKVTGAMEEAGKGLTAGLTAPIVGIGTIALKSAIDFETAFAGIRMSLDATEPEFGKIEAGIRNMAQEMPVSAESIAKVAASAAELGVSSQDLLQFTETAVKLGQVTNMSAEEAATGLKQLTNALDLPVSAAAHLADELVYLGSKGAGTQQQILEMSLRLSGAGKAIGMSVDEIMGWAAAAGSVGLEAQAGGAAISTMFVQVANAVKGLEPSKKELNELAVATKGVEDAAHSMETSQRGVRNASEAVADAQRSLRNAHEGVTTALKGVRDANEGVVTAQRSLRDASEAVTTAQRGVRNAQEGVADAQRQSRLAAQTLSEAYTNLARAQRDQRQASLDSRRETLSVAEAMQGLKEVQAQAGAGSLELKDAQLALRTAEVEAAKTTGKSSLEREQATLRVQQAQQRLQQVMSQGPRYNLELQNAQLRLEEAQNRVGQAAEQEGDKLYNANKQVAAGIVGVNDARKNERNAAEGVGDANKNLRNSYEGVQAAQKGLRDSIEQVQQSQKDLRNAYEGVDSAQRNVRNSQEGVKDAQYTAASAAKDYAEKQQTLADVTDKVKGKLKEYADVAGMSQQAFADLFKSNPSAAMQAVFEGLNKVSKEGGDVVSVLEKMGITSARERDAVLRLAGAGDVLTKALKDSANASGAVDKAFEIKRQTAAAQFDIAKNRIQEAMITLGAALLPIFIEVLDMIQPIIKIIQTLATAFASLPRPVQMVIVALLIALAAIGPLLILFGLLATSVIAVIVVMPILAAIFGALVVPVGLVIIALVAFGLALYALNKYGSDAAAAVIAAMHTVITFFSTEWPKVKDAISGPFKSILESAKGGFGIKDALIGAFNSMVNTIKSIIMGLVSWVSNQLHQIAADAKKILDLANPKNLPHTVGHALGIPGAASGMPNVPRDMLLFVHQGEAIIPRAEADAMRASKAEGGGAGGGGIGGGGNRGLTVAITGPIKVVNNGRRQDAKGAIGNLGYGISNQLQRRGVW